MKKIFYIIITLVVSLTVYAERKEYSGLFYSPYYYSDDDEESEIRIVAYSGDSVLISTKRPHFKMDTLRFVKMDIIVDKELSNKAKKLSITHPENVMHYSPILLLHYYCQYELQGLEYDDESFGNIMHPIINKILKTNAAPNGFMIYGMMVQDRETNLIYPAIQYFNTSSRYPITEMEVEVAYIDDEENLQFNKGMRNYVFTYKADCNIGPHESEYVSLYPDMYNQFTKNLQYYDMEIQSITIKYSNGKQVKLTDYDIKCNEELPIIKSYH
ncbi:MAG: hypothetical protein J1E16_06540 [Muribaculaceae bacterium]|nr:hypothetical protein [Muribaculaceae bacterium]